MNPWQVEVLSVGTWNGDTFTRADLEEIAANFTRLRETLRVPLKFGHDDEQTLLGQADGDPALGWVSGLEARGDRLVATFSRVPPLVWQAVQAGLYRHVSSEIAYEVTVQGERIGKVLVGVALLGADLPAVSNLADLGAYLSARGLTPRRVYRFARAVAGSGSPGRAMTRSERLAGSTPGGARTEAAHREGGPPGEEGPPLTIAKLTADLADRQAEIDRLRGQEQQAQEALRVARFRTERSGLAADLDGWVRQGALTPEARDKALAAVDAQEPSFGTGGGAAEVSFRASLVKELMAAMAKPRPVGREVATAAPLGALARQAAQPAAEALSREAGKLAATGRFTLAQAQARVLAEDQDLAARWLAEVNQTLPYHSGPHDGGPHHNEPHGVRSTGGA